MTSTNVIDSLRVLDFEPLAEMLQSDCSGMPEFEVNSILHGLQQAILRDPASIAEKIKEQVLKAGRVSPLLNGVMILSMDAVFRDKRHNAARKAKIIDGLINDYERQYSTQSATQLFRGSLLLQRGDRAAAMTLFREAAETVPGSVGLPRVYLGAHSVVSDPFTEWDNEFLVPAGTQSNITWISRPNKASASTVVVGSDARYFVNFAEHLVRSLRNTGSTAPVHLHVVNWTCECDSVLNRLGNDVTLSCEEYRYKRDYAYFATVRFFRAAEIAREVGPVYITDIDNEFVADFDRVIERLQPFVAGFRWHSGGNWFPWFAPSGGNLWLNTATDDGRRVADWLSSYIRARFQPNDRRSWWFDQLALNEAYHHALENGLTLANLSDAELSASIARPYNDVASLKAK